MTAAQSHTHIYTYTHTGLQKASPPVWLHPHHHQVHQTPGQIFLFTPLKQLTTHHHHCPPHTHTVIQYSDTAQPPATDPATCAHIASYSSSFSQSSISMRYDIVLFSSTNNHCFEFLDLNPSISKPVLFRTNSPLSHYFLSVLLSRCYNVNWETFSLSMLIRNVLRA